MPERPPETLDELRAMKDRLERVLQGAQDVFVEFDVMRNELYCSPAFGRVFGFPPEHWPRTREQWRALIHPADHPGYSRAVGDYSIAGPFVHECRVRCGSGEYKHVLVRAHIERDSVGRAVRISGSLTDVTDRRMAEAALRGMEDRLREMQKLHAVGLVAGGVAHDFNNLLMAIRGHANLAKGTLPVGHAAAESLDQIEEAARQGTAVTGALLGFARKGRGERAPVELARVAESVAGLFRRLLPGGARLVVDVEGARGMLVMGDASQLQQAVMNLALNARDAVREQGTIRIAVEPVPPASVRLSVSDTGHGIPGELRDRLFEPLFTTKPPDGGTGLGLSVIRGIIESHGGVVEVESAPGRGSTFWFTLACVRDQEATTRAEDPVGDERPPARSAVVVLRNDLIAGLLSSMLRTLGYSVERLESVMEAQARMRHGTTSLPPILLLGGEMLGQDGLGGVRAQHQGGSRVPVVLVCAERDAPKVLGGDDLLSVLHKPFGLADLRRVLQAIRPGRSPDGDADHGRFG